jgi:hypothetical protein
MLLDVAKATVVDLDSIGSEPRERNKAIKFLLTRSAPVDHLRLCLFPQLNRLGGSAECSMECVRLSNLKEQHGIFLRQRKDMSVDFSVNRNNESL